MIRQFGLFTLVTATACVGSLGVPSPSNGSKSDSTATNNASGNSADKANSGSQMSTTGTGSSSTDGLIFPADNPWNTDISQAPLDPKSDDYINEMTPTKGLHPDFGSTPDNGIPYVIIPSGQSMMPVDFVDYPEESDPGPYPVPLTAPIEQSGDAHVLAVDLVNGFLYELYQAEVSGNGWDASNGAKFDLKSNALRPDGWTSADAAGLPIFPGLVRADEVLDKGEINHAIRFSVTKSQKGYVAPARHAAGSCDYGSSCPPLGLRLRLKASVDISGYAAPVKVILTALKKYGMILADNGGNWFLGGAPDPRWDDDVLHSIDGIHGSDFEVVLAGNIEMQE